MDGHRLAPPQGRAPLGPPPSCSSPRSSRGAGALPRGRRGEQGLGFSWEKEIRWDFLWTRGKCRSLCEEELCRVQCLTGSTGNAEIQVQEGGEGTLNIPRLKLSQFAQPAGESWHPGMGIMTYWRPLLQQSLRKGVIWVNSMFLPKPSSGLAPWQVVTMCRGLQAVPPWAAQAVPKPLALQSLILILSSPSDGNSWNHHGSSWQNLSTGA